MNDEKTAADYKFKEVPFFIWSWPFAEDLSKSKNSLALLRDVLPTLSQHDFGQHPPGSSRRADADEIFERRSGPQSS